MLRQSLYIFEFVIHGNAGDLLQGVGFPCKGAQCPYISYDC